MVEVFNLEELRNITLSLNKLTQKVETLSKDYNNLLKEELRYLYDNIKNCIIDNQIFKLFINYY